MEENKFISEFENNSALTENGAVSNKSTKSSFADQFGAAGTYCNRSLSEVFSDQLYLYEENPEWAVRFPFYLRLITRKTTTFDGSKLTKTEKIQKGCGLKDESYKRYLWMAVNLPNTFYKNIHVIPMVGSWKDIWEIMYYDEKLSCFSIIKDRMFKTLMSGLLYDGNLVKKFMPRIKANGKCTTDRSKIMNKLAKQFAKFMDFSYADYNRLKASGNGHDFQKMICSKRFRDIEWNKIPGKALNLLANGNFLKRNGLEDVFSKWVYAQDSITFNGYPYELIKNAYKTNNLYKKVTINKQFDDLINKGRESGGINGNVWCALDTSGSMGQTVSTSNSVSAFDVCVSLGIYFSTLNKGSFNKNVIMFDDESKVKQLKGDFCDMVKQITEDETAWGSTNFQSVVDEIVRVRKENPNIPLEDYPSTLLVVSDMEFNPSSARFEYDFANSDEKENLQKTNYQEMKEKLYKVFPSDFVDEMKFIWWNVCSRNKQYPSTIEDGGTYFLSGFDGNIITLILGSEEKFDENTGKKVNPSMMEIIDKALHQEVLNFVEI